MKFISWNVNGLRACCEKGFKESFAALDADFFCLQETKMQEGQLDLEFEGYRSYWNYAEKKDIPVRLSSAAMPRSMSHTASAWRNMTRKDASSRLKCLTFS